jgi:formate dehydrogenase iron-sulfur subunit
VQQLHAQGETCASLYGADEKILGGLNSFYLLVDKPQVYGLPSNPQLPTRHLVWSSVFSAVGAVVLGLFGLLGLRKRRMEDVAAKERGSEL